MDQIEYTKYVSQVGADIAADFDPGVDLQGIVSEVANNLVDFPDDFASSAVEFLIQEGATDIASRLADDIYLSIQNKKSASKLNDFDVYRITHS